MALGGYVKELQTRPYVWGTDLLPHDAEPERLQTGESIQATLRMDPTPEQVVFDTVLEMASGEYDVRDST